MQLRDNSAFFLLRHDPIDASLCVCKLLIEVEPRLEYLQAVKKRRVVTSCATRQSWKVEKVAFRMRKYAVHLHAPSLHFQ